MPDPPLPSSTPLSLSTGTIDHIRLAAQNGLNFGYIQPPDQTIDELEMRAKGMTTRLTKEVLECAASKTGLDAYSTKFYPPPPVAEKCIGLKRGATWIGATCLRIPLGVRVGGVEHCRIVSKAEPLEYEDY